MRKTMKIASDVIATTGRWWDALNRHQRGMLIAAMSLDEFGASPYLHWESMVIQTQTQIALRMTIVMGICAKQPFPELPHGTTEIVNELPPPVPIH